MDTKGTMGRHLLLWVQLLLHCRSVPFGPALPVRPQVLAIHCANNNTVPQYSVFTHSCNLREGNCRPPASLVSSYVSRD